VDKFIAKYDTKNKISCGFSATHIIDNDKINKNGKMPKFAKILRHNLMTKEKNANIKLPTIGWFFPTHLLPTH